jgi:serine/threonine protein kinase
MSEISLVSDLTHEMPGERKNIAGTPSLPFPRQYPVKNIRETPMPAAQQIIKIGPATYCLKKQIGKSSYGEIWLAQCREAAASVAIKFVRRENMAAAPLDEQYRWVKALNSEISFLRTIRAPHIVTCQRHGEHEGLPVLVLEALDCDLRHIVRQGEAAISLIQALEWMSQITEGLRVIHQLGHCHLDLKPSNLLLTPLGPLGRRIKIADFGTCLAQKEDPHRFPGGTPGWQSPEQFFPAERKDGRFLYHTSEQSDFYALGLIFFFLVTGQRTHFASEAARTFKKEQEQAAWNVRHSMCRELTNQDRSLFLAALGGTANITDGQDEEIGTWLPKVHRHTEAAVAYHHQQPICTPLGDAARRSALALIETLLSPEPRDRQGSAQMVQGAICGVLRTLHIKSPHTRVSIILCKRNFVTAEASCPRIE